MQARQVVKHYMRAYPWRDIDIVKVLTRNPMGGEGGGGWAGGSLASAKTLNLRR